MLRQTFYAGEQDIPIEFEQSWYAKSGRRTLIPMNSKWHTIGIQVSGGLDSAMLMYLTAKTILDHKLAVKILPISFEVPNKAKNLSSARDVISIICQRLNFTQVADPQEIIMPDDHWQDPLKGQFMNNVILDLLLTNAVDFTFNGNTNNPPAEIRQNFPFDEYRQRDRDDRQTIYNGRLAASPHAFMHKQDIIDLYRQHDLLDILAPVTLSCDENLDKIHRYNLSIPCGQCWWCHERKWGFEVLND